MRKFSFFVEFDPCQFREIVNLNTFLQVTEGRSNNGFPYIALGDEPKHAGQYLPPAGIYFLIHLGNTRTDILTVFPLRQTKPFVIYKFSKFGFINEL